MPGPRDPPGGHAPQVVVQIVGNVKIQIAVAVVIHPNRRHAPKVVGHPRAVGYVRESSIAVVVIEGGRLAVVIVRIAVAAHAGAVASAPEIAIGRPIDVVGDDEIETAIVVVVEPESAGVQAGSADPGFLGDICEGAVAVVSHAELARQVVGGPGRAVARAATGRAGRIGRVRVVGGVGHCGDRAGAGKRGACPYHPEPKDPGSCDRHCGDPRSDIHFVPLTPRRPFQSGSISGRRVAIPGLPEAVGPRSWRP